MRKEDEVESKTGINELCIVMRVFTHASIAATFIAFFALTGSGCGLGVAASNIGSTAAADQGNALAINYQRPSDESLNDFESFIKEKNMEITSRNNNTLTASGKLSSSYRNESSQDIRMKVVARENGDNTSLVVITEYLEPTSGEYKRANNDTGTMTTREETQTTEVRTFRRLKRILTSRYGGDNVEAIDSDMTY